MTPDDYAFVFGFSVALPLGALLAMLWMWRPVRKPARDQYDEPFGG